MSQSYKYIVHNSALYIILAFLLFGAYTVDSEQSAAALYSLWTVGGTVGSSMMLSMISVHVTVAAFFEPF